MTRPRLKPINQQVIVITGASSGIGLVTARMAARRGAKVMLVSRNEEELRELCNDLKERGSEAAWMEADVSEPEALERVAEATVRKFGGIDTWVNNAGVSIYGKLADTPLREKRRLFDVNFWGVVNGCRAALPRMRERGGAIINLGSAVSERAIPLQGMYSASKHAVKAYTDALRMELEEEGVPISVSLVKPVAVDTPYPEHAKNRMEEPPRLPPPVYAPEVVARAILTCAEKPVRHVIVGGPGVLYPVLDLFAPRLLDRYMKRTMFRQQKEPGRRRELGQEALFTAPRHESAERGVETGRVYESSWFTEGYLHPGRTLAKTVGLALLTAVAAWGFHRFQKEKWDSVQKPAA